jgi:hypothetical protein
LKIHEKNHKAKQANQYYNASIRVLEAIAIIDYDKAVEDTELLDLNDLDVNGPRG